MRQLNPQQDKAVRHGTGPLLVLAGAGTGKTRVATERMANLLRSGVQAKSILGVTFTNKAANEMRARLSQLVGRRHNIRDLIISTFHSLCVRIIRRDAKLLGLTPSFSICDQGEQMAVARKSASTVKGGTEVKLDDLLLRIGRFKSGGIEPEECSRMAVDEDEMVAAAVYRRYQDALRRQNSVDFDDLLMKSLTLFRRNPETLSYWQDRFEYLLVDEFQDTNPAQFQLVQLLAAPRNNICVVGDDDQSIYAWRGAMAGNILKFRDSYPNAVEITLDQNYRSTATILSAANAVIKNNSARREKNLWSTIGQGIPIRVRAYNDQFEEAAGIAAEIRDGVAGEGKRRFRDYAIIIRANSQGRLFEDEFIASRIPYEVVGGQSLFDYKESRDVLAFLALLANPDADNQLLRVINVPPRGIGEKTIDLLIKHAHDSGKKVLDILREPDAVPGISTKAADSCRTFSRQIAGWREKLLRDGPDGLVQAILTDTSYETELASLYHDPIDAAARWNQALEVGGSLSTFFQANSAGNDAEMVLAEFLRETTLSGRADDTSRKDGLDAVRIITGHSAKGLEFPYVFVPGMEEELFPHKHSLEESGIEEERRLFYVAMTRARLELTLTRARIRVSRGKEIKRKPSRFLEELPVELIQIDDTPTRREEAMEWIAELKGKLNRNREAGG